MRYRITSSVSCIRIAALAEEREQLAPPAVGKVLNWLRGPLSPPRQRARGLFSIPTPSFMFLSRREPAFNGPQGIVREGRIRTGPESSEGAEDDEERMMMMMEAKERGGAGKRACIPIL